MWWVILFTKDSGKGITPEEKLTFHLDSPDACRTIQHAYASQHTSNRCVHGLINQLPWKEAWYDKGQGSMQDNLQKWTNAVHLHTF